MLDLGSYLLGALQLALVLAPLAFCSFRLRQRLLPAWSGAPARLVESITGVALLIWLSESLKARIGVRRLQMANLGTEMSG